MIVERGGTPIIAILPISEYHRLLNVEHFGRLAYYSLGSEAEAQGLTEDTLEEEIEETKREIFGDRYFTDIRRTSTWPHPPTFS